MCGRFGLDLPPRRVAETFDLDDEPNIQARYNIAPSQLVAAVMVHPQSRKRVLRALAWGLVPAWAKDAKGKRPINARAETVRTKPAFREAFAARRCILPASHFFEWRMSADGSKTPHCIRLAGGEPMALAAIWESWRDPAAPDAAVLFTCAVLTSPANAFMTPLHERMPVILPPRAFESWLTGETDEASALLLPFDGAMEAWPVSSAVNQAVSEGSELVRPLPEAPIGQ